MSKLEVVTSLREPTPHMLEAAYRLQNVLTEEMLAYKGPMTEGICKDIAAQYWHTMIDAALEEIRE